MAGTEEAASAGSMRTGTTPAGNVRPDVSWPVGEAKAKFSEVIEMAQDEGPQTIAKRGKPVAVIVSVDEWERRTARRGTLAEFFESIRPDDADGLEIPEVDWAPRPVEFD